MNFGAYSAYYDLLNEGKDYLRESDYVAARIRRFSPSATHMLELGCGTGNHAYHLQKKGFTITGIERSAGMAELGRQKNIPGFRVIDSDIRTMDLPETYDCVISLFHVMSYLTSNADLLLVLQKVSKALIPGGIFLFDTWFTPAVYHQLPSHRERKFENEGLQVTRTASSITNVRENTVEVTYDIHAFDKIGQTREQFQETHVMRHFGVPEIAMAAASQGFDLVAAEEFLKGGPPTLDTWGVCFILKKR